MGAIVRLYRGQNHYDFPRIWKWGVRFSLALFVISVVSLGGRGLNLGIDFEGGVAWSVKAPDLTVEQVRDALRPLGLADAKIQTVGPNMRVAGPDSASAQKDEVRAVVADLAHVDPTAVSVAVVGPTWGGEITASAVRALIVFLICILGYVTLTFRGEWKMAVGVVVAVIHDVVISVGVYSVFHFEVTPATIIAFLTILGFSIYDTVVVYDKVLENLAKVGLSSRMSYTDMMSLSMNQVLTRSINTSITGVLPVVSTLVVGALILGATTLGEFSIALTVGLMVGAYSSVFVAAPVVVWMKEREPRNVALRERLAKTSTPPAPPTGDGRETAPVAAAATATKTGAPAAGDAPALPAGTGTRSGSIPPRPRKQGKRR